MLDFSFKFRNLTVVRLRSGGVHHRADCHSDDLNCCRDMESFHFYSAPLCSHCKRCTSYSNSACLSVCLSVRLSVCHTPVLCQNDGT